MKRKKDSKDFFKNRIVTLLLKSGICLDYCLPYILSATILFFGEMAIFKTRPFFIDNVSKPVVVECIDTSTGVHEVFDYDFDIDISDSIFHTTGWTINEEGKYQRDVIFFKVKNSNLYPDSKELLKLNKEEFLNEVEICDACVVECDFIEGSNSIYIDDMYVVRSSYLDKNHTYSGSENFESNFFKTLLFLFLSYYLGNHISCFFNKKFSIRLSDKLALKLSSYVPFDDSRGDCIDDYINLRNDNIFYFENGFVDNPERPKVKVRKKEFYD